MKRVLECPACSESGRPRTFIQADAVHRERFASFSRINYCGVMDDWLDDLELVVMTCDSCGHFWYRDQPSWDQLTAMYAATAVRHAAKGVSPEPTLRSRTQMSRFFRLVGGTGELHPPTMLDYGSGFGRWVRAAGDAGFAVTGFEPSAERGHEGKQDYTVVQDLTDLSDRRFDAINIEQVLEHIADPFAALSDLHQYCHSATVLRITVPNLRRSYEGATLWADWPYDGERPHTLAPFEHLQGFVPSSLRTLAKRAGFREVGLAKVLATDPVLAARRALRHVYPDGDSTLLFLQPLAGHPSVSYSVRS